MNQQWKMEPTKEKHLHHPHFILKIHLTQPNPFIVNNMKGGYFEQPYLDGKSFVKYEDDTDGGGLFIVENRGENVNPTMMMGMGINNSSTQTYLFGNTLGLNMFDIGKVVSKMVIPKYKTEGVGIERVNVQQLTTKERGQLRYDNLQSDVKLYDTYKEKKNESYYLRNLEWSGY